MDTRTLRATWLLSIVAAGALGVAATVWFSRKETLPPALTSFEKMGHLVSLKINFADVVEFTEHRSLGIPWSRWELRYAGTKVLLVAKGDCSVVTDLRFASYQAVDSAKHKVAIELPAPVPFQPRLNHAPAEQGGTTIYAISSQGIEAVIPGDANRVKAVESAMAIAQRKIEQACANQEALTAAKSHAERVLLASFNAIGWNASVVWR
jgi:hypothetical protein